MLSYAYDMTLVLCQAAQGSTHIGCVAMRKERRAGLTERLQGRARAVIVEDTRSHLKGDLDVALANFRSHHGRADHGAAGAAVRLRVVAVVVALSAPLLLRLHTHDPSQGFSRDDQLCRKEGIKITLPVAAQQERFCCLLFVP